MPCQQQVGGGIPHRHQAGVLIDKNLQGQPGVQQRIVTAIAQ